MRQLQKYYFLFSLLNIFLICRLLVMTTDLPTDIDTAVSAYYSLLENKCKSVTSELTKKVTDLQTELYSTLSSAIKSKVLETTGDSDMYDYSDLPEVKVERHNIITGSHDCYYKSYDGCRSRSYETKCFICVIDNIPEIEKTFAPGEKWVYCKGGSYPYTHGRDYYGLAFTNFGTYLGSSGFGKLSFWIPKDYIQIITTLDKDITHRHIINYIQPYSIISALQLIRDRLYNRKYVPLYARDLVIENARLTAEHEKFTTEYKYQETLTLADIRQQLSDHKAELDTERDKLKLAAKKLAVERQAFELERQKFDSLSLDDLLIPDK